MIFKDLIQQLHDKGIIDKRHVLWWQLGFEGRKVLTDEEFRGGLRDITYWARNPKEPDDKFPINLRVWTDHNVPINLRDIEISGIQIPCFITCCPMSHERSWITLENAISGELPIQFTGIYNQPHIRGVVIEANKDFLFWHPFLFGEKQGNYNTLVLRFPGLDIPIFIDPIYSVQFCKNLINKEWHTGKRAQRKPEKLNLEIRGLQVVPYFEFSPEKPNIMVYPLPVFDDNSPYLIKALVKQSPSLSQEQARHFINSYPHLFHIRKRLDLPILIRSLENRKVEILGAGYLYSDYAYYWKLI